MLDMLLIGQVILRMFSVDPIMGYEEAILKLLVDPGSTCFPPPQTIFNLPKKPLCFVL